MARKNDVLGVVGAETLIGTGVVAQGNLKSDADIIIDGSFTGDILASGDVTLGINGTVKGDITANNIIIMGALKGNLLSEGETIIRESGNVLGDIVSLSLEIKMGGIFNGKSKMQTKPSLSHKDLSSSQPIDKITT